MQENALYTITNGLYVLSVQDGEGYAGSLVDAVSQIAVSPYLIMVSCMNNSHTKSCIEKAGEFGISVLAKETDPFVVANFGYQSSRDVKKWQNIPFAEIDGLPYISDALAKIRVRVVNKLIYASNTVFIAEGVDAFDSRSGEPLTYKYYRDGFKEQVAIAFSAYKAGRSAGNAACKKSQTAMSASSSSSAAQPSSPASAEKRWTCTLCGYVYEGDIPFEELPEDWRCPLCGVGKDMFELQ